MIRTLQFIFAFLIFISSAFSQSKEGTPTITRAGSSRPLDVILNGSDGTSMSMDNGRIVIKRGSVNQYRNTVTLTGTTETTLIPAVSGIRHCLQFLIIYNASSTDRVTLSLRDSTGGTVIPLGGFEPNASGKSPAIPFHFPVSLEQTTANNNWTIQATGTSPNVTIVAVSERVN